MKDVDKLIDYAATIAEWTKAELIEACQNIDFGKPKSYYKTWSRKDLAFYLLQDYLRMKG